MSEMKDSSTESPDEDTASLHSMGVMESLEGNGKTPTDGGVKQPLGVMQSFRRSLRRAAEKSPLSPGKGSKVTRKDDTAGNESGSQPPPSPSEYRQGCYENLL